MADVTSRQRQDQGADLLEVALRQLQRRRRDRWLVAAVLVVAVVAAFAVLLVEGLAVATSPWMAVGFLAATLLYVASVVFQEDRSRQAVRALLEERERLDALAERATPLEVVHGAVCAAADAADLPAVLDELLWAVVSLTDASRGAVVLQTGDVLTVAVAMGPGAPPAEARLPEDDGATWAAVRAGTPVEVGRGSEWGMVADATTFAVPFAVPSGDRHAPGDVPVTGGALVVERPSDGTGFTAEERLAVAVVAEQAGLAVRHAACLERLAEQAGLAVRHAARLERLAEQAAALDATRRERIAELVSEIRDHVDLLRGSSASVTGTVQLLLHRGEEFPLARRQALLDDVLRKTSHQRELLTHLEELAREPLATQAGSGTPEPT
jgi:hypothetical protein